MQIRVEEKLKIFIRTGMILNHGVIFTGKTKKIQNKHPIDGKDDTLKN